ncbi:unnamed protein product [Parnassius apollo]|uniref:(apollo) hypothetical protein n=1 Tax=Parnassius apollo TaxID=110799 RepID=A0A8S3XNS3_PARAO|nr:unnamed protein product [Parnassius apollo]
MSDNDENSDCSPGWTTKKRSAMSSPAAAYASAEKETSNDDTGTSNSTSSVMEKELNKAIEKSKTKTYPRSVKKKEDNI